jgi:putative protein-disulfide isomerase
VLAQAAAATLAHVGHDVTPAAFRAEWDQPATIAETRADFAYVRSLGINSFPALLLETDAGLYEISPGYARVDQLERQLNATLQRVEMA